MKSRKYDVYSPTMSSNYGSDPRLPSLNLDVLGQRSHTSTPAQGINPNRKQGAAKGDVIGERYVVDGQIARGGMGRVLKVRHLVLDKAFALKLPRTNQGTESEVRQRFYSEARMASSLNHQNICSIVDFGEDPHFGLFMVMELLEGQALKEKLRSDGRMSPKVTADVMAQIAEALRYVHSQGVIHGDIKPDNILLVRTSNHRRLVKLLDFGLAHPREAESEGTVRGTPEYLAPERIRKAPPSVASDIYALGILFYELLVGRPPFSGSVTEVLRRHLDEEIPDPSSLIAENLDERADLIIRRATNKDPSQRHPSASNFLYELHAFCDMHGISVRRRTKDSAILVRNAASQAAIAGAEVFEESPIPLAAVSKDGTIRLANRAFLSFLGRSNLTEALRLPQTALMKVYPSLVKDLSTVATTGASIKTSFSVSIGEGEAMTVALVMSAPAAEDCTASGAIHIALYPIV